MKQTIRSLHFATSSFEWAHTSTFFAASRATVCLRHDLLSEPQMSSRDTFVYYDRAGMGKQSAIAERLSNNEKIIKTNELTLCNCLLLLLDTLTLMRRWSSHT